MINFTPDPLDSDKFKQTFSYFSDLYNEAKSYSIQMKSQKLQPLSSTTKQVNKQINKKVYLNLDKPSRVKAIQLACESPDVITMFQKNKLFTNEVKSARCLIPEDKRNLRIQPLKIIENKPKPDPQKKFLLTTRDLKTGIFMLKQENMKNEQIRSESCKKYMCSILKNIKKQCDLTTELNSSGHLETSLEPQKKFVKNWTERIKWTANQLQHLSKYNKPIAKEFYLHELYKKCLEKIDADNINKELLNKSSNNIKSQFSIYKKIMLKKRLKNLN